MIVPGLQVVVEQHLHAMFDTLKSSPNCSSWQAPLDRKRLWAQIHRYLNGPKFAKLMATPDDKLELNAIALQARAVLTELPAADLRTATRFLHGLSSELPIIFAESPVRSSWRNIEPFNQDNLLSYCSLYAQFSNSEKVELASRMPELISRSMTAGTPDDVVVFALMGDIIGLPSRGLPGTSPVRSATEGIIWPHALNCASRTGLEECDCGPNDSEPVVRTAVRAKPVVPIAVLPLNQWRAIFLTEATMRRRQLEAEQRLSDATAQKKQLIEERERLKKAKAEGKVQRAEEAAMKKAAGPLRKIVQPTRWECSNTACCARWVTPELGLKSKWLGCDHCNRWWCPRSECLAQLKVHEPICRLLAIEEKKQADADLRRNWKP